VIYKPDLRAFLTVSPVDGHLILVSIDVDGGAEDVLTRMYNDPKYFSQKMAGSHGGL
jgi:hypothetical protein